MANSFDLQRLILLITGAVFAGFSLLCLLYPDLLTRMTGILAPTLTSQIELQAVYGGLQLGLGSGGLSRWGWRRSSSTRAAPTSG